MLLYIDGEVIEIRPGEFFESKNFIESRFLEVINKPEKPKKKIGRPKTKEVFLDGSSSTQS